MNTTTSPQSIIMDPTGLPMIHVPAINAWIGWLPFTMIQLETFLCEQPDPRFSNNWYRSLEHAQNRVSPQQVTYDNLYRVFATQLTPAEIQRVCEWLKGRDKHEYRLPTADEWKVAYRELERLNTPPNFLSSEQSERIQILLNNIDSAIRSKLQQTKDSQTISARMLMGRCVRELSTGTDKFFTHGREQLTEDNVADLAVADALKNPDDRSRSYGFRLLRKCK